MSWATHFQAISSGDQPTASFGTTLFGKYTVAELQSLINAKDDEVAVLTKYAPKASAAWQSDFKALQSDYAQVRAAGLAAIAGQKYSIFADNLNPEGDSYYKAILGTFNPRWQQHDASTDRLGLLHTRLASEGISVAPYTVRQPGPKDDAMNYAEAHPVDYFIASPAKGLIQGAQDAAKPLLDWSRPIVIAVAAIAGVMGFFLIKSYLPAPHIGQLPVARGGS
jgi:hypothetical protein